MKFGCDPCRRMVNHVMCRFHLGSLAFGSLIIAIIQFVRLVLEYVDRKTQTMQVGCAGGN